MTATGESSARRLRAEHILDVTRDLILRWGVKRVSIEEVAERAEVGKGTVYLHWRSRQELVSAVLLRAALGVIDELVEGTRQDPRQGLPHNRVRNLYLLTQREPMIQAMVSEDHEVLGRQLDQQRAGELRERFTSPHSPSEPADARPVLRPDLAPDEVDYIVGSILGGFFHRASRELGTPQAPSLERRAELLAGAVQRAVENPEEPSEDAVRRFAEATLTPLLELRDLARSALQKAYA